MAGIYMVKNTYTESVHFFSTELEAFQFVKNDREYANLTGRRIDEMMVIIQPGDGSSKEYFFYGFNSLLEDFCAEYDVSCRIYNLLCRAGYKTMEEVEAAYINCELKLDNYTKKSLIEVTKLVAMATGSNDICDILLDNYHFYEDILEGCL